jgi:hypothetical protein
MTGKEVPRKEGESLTEWLMRIEEESESILAGKLLLKKRKKNKSCQSKQTCCKIKRP